jgi:predicted transcriptional regulator
MQTPKVQERGADRAKAMSDATVGDYMHAGVVDCPPETDLTTIARIMARDRIHAVVVSGSPWSLVSDLDLVAAAARDARDGCEAGEIAATEIVTVDPREPLEHAAELMAQHHLSHLLVVEGAAGRPVGVISTLDVARALASG